MPIEKSRSSVQLENFWKRYRDRNHIVFPSVMTQLFAVTIFPLLSFRQGTVVKSPWMAPAVHTLHAFTKTRISQSPTAVRTKCTSSTKLVTSSVASSYREQAEGPDNETCLSFVAIVRAKSLHRIGGQILFSLWVKTGKLCTNITVKASPRGTGYQVACVSISMTTSSLPTNRKVRSPFLAPNLK